MVVGTLRSLEALTQPADAYTCYKRHEVGTSLFLQSLNSALALVPKKSLALKKISWHVWVLFQ